MLIELYQIDTRNLPQTIEKGKIGRGGGACCAALRARRRRKVAGGGRFKMSVSKLLMELQTYHDITSLPIIPA